MDIAPAEVAAAAARFGRAPVTVRAEAQQSLRFLRPDADLATIVSDDTIIDHTTGRTVRRLVAACADLTLTLRVDEDGTTYLMQGTYVPSWPTEVHAETPASVVRLFCTADGHIARVGLPRGLVRLVLSSGMRPARVVTEWVRL